MSQPNDTMPDQRYASTSAADYDLGDYPEFLGHNGHRIATCTQVLSRLCNRLIENFDISPSIRVNQLFSHLNSNTLNSLSTIYTFQDFVLEVWQKYLAINGVAFFDDECVANDCTDETKIFRPFIIAKRM